MIKTGSEANGLVKSPTAPAPLVKSGLFKTQEVNYDYYFCFSNHDAALIIVRKMINVLFWRTERKERLPC